MYSLLPCQRPAPFKPCGLHCTNLAAATSIQRQRAWHAELCVSPRQRRRAIAIPVQCVVHRIMGGTGPPAATLSPSTPLPVLEARTQPAAIDAIHIMVRALTTTALFASPLAEARPQLLQLVGVSHTVRHRGFVLMLEKTEITSDTKMSQMDSLRNNTVVVLVS